MSEIRRGRFVIKGDALIARPASPHIYPVVISDLATQDLRDLRDLCISALGTSIPGVDTRAWHDPRVPGVDHVKVATAAIGEEPARAIDPKDCDHLLTTYACAVCGAAIEIKQDAPDLARRVGALEIGQGNLFAKLDAQSTAIASRVEALRQEVEELEEYEPKIVVFKQLLARQTERVDRFIAETRQVLRNVAHGGFRDDVNAYLASTSELLPAEKPDGT